MGKQNQQGQLVRPTFHSKLGAGPGSLPGLCPTPWRAVHHSNCSCASLASISQAKSGLGSMTQEWQKKKIQTQFRSYPLYFPQWMLSFFNQEMLKYTQHKTQSQTLTLKQ